MEFSLIVLALLTLITGLAQLGPVIYADVAPLAAEPTTGPGVPVVAAVAVCLAGLGLALGLHRRGSDVVWPPPGSAAAGLLRLRCHLRHPLRGPVRHICGFLAKRVDVIFSRNAPDYLGESAIQSSQTVGLMQSGSLRMYALAVAAGVAIFILFTYICLHQMGAGGVS